MRVPLGLLLIFVLIGLMMDWNKPVALSLNGQRSVTVTDINNSRSLLLSEAELPADASVWSGCCSHRDCMEAPVTVVYQNADWARVSIADFPAFELETWKIHPSKNGRAYFCRRELSRPPDTENTRCVFVGSSGHTRAIRKESIGVSKTH